MDYIHINPVKHGLAARASDWPNGSIHRFIRTGQLRENWATADEAFEAGGDDDVGVRFAHPYLCGSLALGATSEERVAEYRRWLRAGT